MNSRERIKATFAFEKTDRIPRYEIFLDEYKQKFRKYYNLPDDADVYSYYNKVDIGTVLADQRGPFYRSEYTESDDGDTHVDHDSWGRTLYLRRSAYFEKVLDVIIKEKSSLDEFVFDDPCAADKYHNFASWAHDANQRFTPVSGVLGLFMGSYRMRGEYDYLMDLAEDPDFCNALAGRLADFTTKAGLTLARITNTMDTAVWVYDEFSSTKGPLFSPATFEKVFYPQYKKMIGAWKSAGIKNVVLHCDGNCAPLLDMLLDAGFNGLQGIAPSTGMWLPDIKKKYGNRLVLIGGMCNIHTLVHGTKEEIRWQTDMLIEVAKDRGVIIGTHSIDADVSVESYNYYSSIMDEYDGL